MQHPFFKVISEVRDMQESIRFSDKPVPEPHKPDTVKAILLGADPTNNGLKSEGPILLEKVFGLDSIYESAFFGPHKINLNAIGLSKDNVYAQNVCRNYFIEQTGENKLWYKAANFWMRFLKEELESIPPSVPILASCAQVFTLLTGRKKPFGDIYRLETNPVFFSTILQRNVFALFRGRSYILHEDNWNDYKIYLKDYFING